MKKIVVFFPSFNVGGVEKVMINIANSLIDNGFSVHLVVANDSGDLKKLLSEKIPVHSLGNKRLRSCFFKYLNCLKIIRPDVILSAPNVPNLLSILGSKILNIDCIITQHSYFDLELKRLGLIGKIIPQLIRLLYNHSSHIVAVSEGIKMMLINLGISHDKISTIYNPIDINNIINNANEKLDSPIENEYIIFAGRLDYIKNVELLINAYVLLAEKISFDLIIMGDGSEKTYLQQIVNSKGLSHRIKFLDFKYNPYPYIKNAKLLILPSFSESFGNIVIEAMCLGVNSVCTPTEGVKEITQSGKYAFLADTFNNAVEFADKILEAYSSPIDSTILESFAKKYDIKISINKYLDIVNKYCK